MSKIDLITYMEKYVSNPKKRSKYIDRRGYDNPDQKGNMIAQKKNYMTISWEEKDGMVNIKYYIVPFDENCPFEGVNVYKYIQSDYEDDRTPKDWETEILDVDDNIYEDILEQARERKREMIRNGIVPGVHPQIGLVIDNE